MRRIMAVENLTLDGVMQAPGDPAEDTRGGFRHGGWAGPYADEVMGQEMSKGFGTGDLLLGRWTYQKFHRVWADRTDGNPFTPVLTDTRKWVVSSTLSEPLPWVNSTLLPGPATASVAALKARPGADLTILGSGALTRSLLSEGLIDSLCLLIHPRVLGEGQRLFAAPGASSRFTLTDSVTTTTGVIIATYERAS